MNNAYLFEGLPAGPQTVRILMEGLPAENLDNPTHPGRFSPREVVAHLADWEPRLAARIRSAIESQGVAVDVWDEGELAIENGYAQSDWRSEVERFCEAREETIRMLRSLDAESFQRTFRHPERGLMTIEDQAAFLLGHDLYHIEQLASAGA